MLSGPELLQGHGCAGAGPARWRKRAGTSCICRSASLTSTRPSASRTAACKAIRDGRCHIPIPWASSNCAKPSAPTTMPNTASRSIPTRCLSPRAPRRPCCWPFHSCCSLATGSCSLGPELCLLSQFHPLHRRGGRFCARARGGRVPVSRRSGQGRMNDDVRGILVNSPSNPTGDPGPAPRCTAVWLSSACRFFPTRSTTDLSMRGRSTPLLNSRTTASSSTAFPSSTP